MRRNDWSVVPPLQGTVSLHQADTQAPVVERVPLLLYARIRHLVMTIGEEIDEYRKQDRDRNGDRRRDRDNDRRKDKDRGNERRRYMDDDKSRQRERDKA